MTTQTLVLDPDTVIGQSVNSKVTEVVFFVQQGVPERDVFDHVMQIVDRANRCEDNESLVVLTDNVKAAALLKESEVNTIVVEPDWNADGKAAGYRRNERVLGLYTPKAGIFLLSDPSKDRIIANMQEQCALNGIPSMRKVCAPLAVTLESLMEI